MDRAAFSRGEKNLSQRVYLEYPKMLYHPDGTAAIAESPEAEDGLTARGWSTDPQAAPAAEDTTEETAVTTSKKRKR